MPVIIKRYTNRKFYNTRSKQYISLEQMAELVRQGVEIQVIDHETREDQTSIVLSQILVQQEKKCSGNIPVQFLAVLIRFGENALDTLRESIIKTLDIDHYFESELERRIDQLIKHQKIQSDSAENIKSMLLGVGSETRENIYPFKDWIRIMLDANGFVTNEEIRKLVVILDKLEGMLDRLQDSS